MRNVSLSEFDLDWEAVKNEIVVFIQRTVRAAGAEGTVVGLSGGVDSSLVVKLLVLALGKEHVMGVLLPTAFTPKEDIDDAKSLAAELRIKSELVNIQPIVNGFSESLGIGEELERPKIPLANIRSRTRMIILYYFANLNNYLVAGTGDRSEDLIGYFTKYGDGGVDFLPIAHLYKSQVRSLAKDVGISPQIVEKPSSPNLWEGHKATDEIPLDYSELDQALICLFDLKMAPEDVSKRLGISDEKVRDILSRFRKSAHKRSYPPMIGSWLLETSLQTA